MVLPATTHDMYTGAALPLSHNQFYVGESIISSAPAVFRSIYCSDMDFFGELLSELQRSGENDTKARRHNISLLLDRITSYYQVSAGVIHAMAAVVYNILRVYLFDTQDSNVVFVRPGRVANPCCHENAHC
jgi:hypothetical protein